MTTTADVFELVNKNLPNHKKQFKLLQEELAKYPNCKVTFLPNEETKRILISVEIPSDRFETYKKRNVKGNAYILLRGLAEKLAKQYEENSLTELQISSVELYAHKSEDRVVITGAVKFTTQPLTNYYNN